MQAGPSFVRQRSLGYSSRSEDVMRFTAEVAELPKLLEAHRQEYGDRDLSTRSIADALEASEDYVIELYPEDAGSLGFLLRDQLEMSGGVVEDLLLFAAKPAIDAAESEAADAEARAEALRAGARERALRG